MKNNINIAGIRTIQDWRDLSARLSVHADENWDIAFQFFEERITTRYLNPIRKILEMDLNTGEGFAVVNLQCSLIETIECFWNGWIYEFKVAKKGVKPSYKYKMGPATYKGSRVRNRDIFIKFFEEREPFKSLGIDGDDFFENVRCGLLHETQTKNNWVIRKEEDMQIEFYKVDGNKKIIYRKKFQDAIETVITEFKSQLVTNGNSSLRQNFVDKFNHMCTKS